MTLKYYVINGDNFVAAVYMKDNDKIIFVRNPEINFEYGLRIVDRMGHNVVDEDVRLLMIKYLFPSEKYIEKGM